MGQRSNNAAVKDAQIKSSKEECVFDMGQRRNANNAAVKGSAINPYKGECAGGTGQIIAIHMTNLPHSDICMDQHMMKQLQLSPIDMLLQLQLQVVKIIHVAILLGWSCAKLSRKFKLFFCQDNV
jgi:hypothetical protein